MLVTDNYKTEFWYHVADQKEIPIYGNVDRTIDIDKLQSIVSDLPDDNEERRDYLKGVVFSDPDTLDFLRTFVGVSDKRMYLELSYIFGKTRCEKDSSKNILDYSIYDLKKHDVPYFKRLISKGGESAKIAVGIIVDYLIDKGVVTILQTIKSVSRDQLQVVVDSLISPKEVQQEETKRRGHGAEQQFAIILHQLGVAYIPPGKQVKPMGTQDPNVDRYTFQIADRVEGRTWSFDVIIKDANGNLKVFTQGLIHTSDPGQYGVNKSAETSLVKNDLISYNSKNDDNAELWGLVDGVGFIENPNNTIFKMLESFDYFVQMKSLYKIALRLHKLHIVRVKAIRFDMDFYSQDDADAMFEKYGSEDIIKITDRTIPEGTEIQAGKAWIYI